MQLNHSKFNPPRSEDREDNNTNLTGLLDNERDNDNFVAAAAMASREDLPRKPDPRDIPEGEFKSNSH